MQQVISRVVIVDGQEIEGHSLQPMQVGYWDDLNENWVGDPHNAFDLAEAEETARKLAGIVFEVTGDLIAIERV